MKATLIYNLMHDWIIGGRLGPVPVSVTEAEEFGLGTMVSQLASLGQSSLQMLAGPLDSVVLTGANSTVFLNDSTVLETLEEMAKTQREKAKIRYLLHLNCGFIFKLYACLSNDREITDV